MEEEFDLTEKKTETLRRVMNNHADLHDVQIEHVWFEEGDILYHGRVLPKRSKARIPMITVAYWSNDETEDDAVDCKISLIHF